MKMLSSCGLKGLLGTRLLGSRVYYLDSAASTQDEARAAALSGSPGGTVVIAGTQTGGRGKFGSEWFSPRGGVWLSVVLYPEPGVNPAVLTLAGAAAAAEAVRTVSGLEAVIRWPNDCFVNGSKAAGVIGEKSGRAVIIGIGVNLNVPPCSFPESLRGKAASISAEAGFVIDENRFLGALLRNFEDMYFAAAGNAEKLAGRLGALSELRGRSVNGLAGGRRVEGTVLGYGTDGSIIIRLDSGEQAGFNAGEFKIEKGDAGVRA